VASQVPVLVNPGVLSIPITESIDISYYICARYPSLLPVEHKDQITKLLHDLHEVNYFSLSFYQGPPVARWTEAYVQRLLATPGLSARYIEALKYKLKV
jgi:glutathione S-transferase